MMKSMAQQPSSHLIFALRGRPTLHAQAGGIVPELLKNPIASIFCLCLGEAVCVRSHKKDMGSGNPEEAEKMNRPPWMEDG